MPINDITDWSTTADNNTDVAGFDISEGCNPRNINDAMRNMMAHVAGLRDGQGAGLQPLNANLTSLSGLTLAANRGLYSTAAGTLDLFTLTAAGRNLIDDPDAAAMRLTLGLDQVDNTADANKPVSNAVQAAIDAIETGSVWSAWTKVTTTADAAKLLTGLPTGLTEIEIQLQQVSNVGNDNFLLQIGAGSVETSGYISQSAVTGSQTRNTSSAGFIISATSAAREVSGRFSLSSPEGNLWIAEHSLSGGADTVGAQGGGILTLSSDIDRIQLTTPNGVNTFDNGAFFVRWR